MITSSITYVYLFSILKYKYIINCLVDKYNSGAILHLQMLYERKKLDGIAIDDIHDRINSLQEEKVKLQETITKLSTPNLPETEKKLSHSDVLSLKDSFESIILSNDVSAKQNLVHTLIQKILVNEEENSFEIIWNF